MEDHGLQRAIYNSIQSSRPSGGGGGGGGGLIPARSTGGSVGASHIAAHRQRIAAQDRAAQMGQRAADARFARGLREDGPQRPARTGGRLAREGIVPSAGPSVPTRGSPTKRAQPADRATASRPPQLKGDGSTRAAPMPHGMPTDLPDQAAGALARRCDAQGVSELAVPKGDGWMQRAGRGEFATVAEPAAKPARHCMQVESAESGFFLLTYDQTPDAHCVRTAHYRLDAHARILGGGRQEYLCIVLDWNRCAELLEVTGQLTK